MKNQTYLIHSGTSISDADTQQWKLNHRSAINPFDAPLSEAGKLQICNLAKNIEHIDVIYCSPMARTIESALIIKEKFDVPVRVEYGLAESPILTDFTGVVTPKFINGTFVKLVPNHIEFNERDYYSLFDDDLFPDALYAKYPQLDSKYTPVYLPQQIPFSEDDCQYGNRMIRVMNKLTNQVKNVAFIGHKGVVTLAAVYLRKIQQGLSDGHFFRPINSVYFGDKLAYGLMIKFSGKEMNIIE
jgi:broad specificity phosphatase PhoE